ncbi:MAG: hypothetical protein ABIN83_06875 [Sphingomicrobium sp.]
MPTRADATVSVRVVSGARVHLGPPANGAEQRWIPASVRIEDGSRRPALLVEFQ